jgi:septal ring factor EnvC (AmiA/AmiB activator)
MIVEIRSDEKRFANQIRIKQKQAQDIDKQIEMIIAEATAKVKNKGLPEFNLTAEAKLISKKFNENKGKLPWPVEKGIVILKYGKQPHPIVRTTTIQSNGVRILTSQNQEVRAIFDGKVYSIIISKNGSHAILVQHGNFFSVYKNLSEIYVKKGETIETKQVIGKLITNKSSGQTILNFSIFKDGVTQNPSAWIYKM